jgi:peptidoglycan/LPS O-acetylase OafA/YrhL
MDSLTTVQARLQKGNIPSLDGVRGIAALIVVAYHFGWPSFTPSGEFGVLVFFVLSGFLITWLLLKEADRYGSISLSNFYKRRFLRIFPAFYCYWLINVTSLRLLHRSIPWRECLSALFYVSNYYYPLQHPSGNVMGMSWSLGVEEQFYLLWPFVFMTFCRRLSSLARGLGIFVGCVFIYRLFLQFGLHVSGRYIQYAFECRLDHLMIGALTAIALKAGWFPGLWRAICAKSTTVAVVAMLWVSTVLDKRFDYAYSHTIGFEVEPILVAVVLVQLIYFSDRVPGSLLNHPIARYCGRISYPMYLYHTLAMMWVAYLLTDSRYAIIYSAGVVLTVGAASASYFVVERPFLRMKDRIARSRLSSARPEISVVSA